MFQTKKNLIKSDPLDTFFVVTTPGLEELTAHELRRLELSPVSEPGQIGGVSFRGQINDLYRANLHLHTANRVLVRLGEFYAAAFSELRKKASRLPWERFIKPGQPVRFSVSCHRSRLYHSDAVAERVAGAIGDHLGQVSPVEKREGEISIGYPQLVHVRLVNDLCTISIDSSSDLLHRRGYRLETAKAPLRETLAAAMLMASGWNLSAPLIDPFCGSGTIGIEAVLLAKGTPPGGKRQFAFMYWPGYDPSLWQNMLSEANSTARSELPVIQASDRDAGAIRIARANAERAGVSDAIEFCHCAISAIKPPSITGWVVTNPPYGLRVSQGKELRDLYAQLGNVLRAQCPGWQVALLAADPKLIGQTRIAFHPVFSTQNGGVNVKLVVGQITQT